MSSSPAWVEADSGHRGGLGAPMMTPSPCTSAENSVTLDAGQLFPSALEHLAVQSDRGQRACPAATRAC